MNNIADKAIKVVLKHEGGFSDHKDDPGGPTQFGISLRTLASSFMADPILFSKFDIDNDGKITVSDIKNLTKEKAAEYYYDHWWKRYNFDYIPLEHIAIKCFDLAVNIGPKRAIKHLQQSINSIELFHQLKEDGVLGPATEKALSSIAESDKKLSNLYAIFILNVELYYQEIVQKVPKLKSFLKGWLNRLYDNEHIQSINRKNNS